MVYFSLVKQSQKKYLSLTRVLVIKSLVLNEAHTMRAVRLFPTTQHTKLYVGEKKPNMHSKRKKILFKYFSVSVSN